MSFQKRALTSTQGCLLTAKELAYQDAKGESKEDEKRFFILPQILCIKFRFVPELHFLDSFFYEIIAIFLKFKQVIDLSPLNGVKIVSH